MTLSKSPDAPTRKRRETQRVPIAQLESGRRRLDRTPAEFSVELGYSDNAYAGWARMGAAPRVAALAAEALVRRQSASDVVFLVRVVKGAPEVTLIDAAETAMIAGRRYLMVPV